MTTPETDEGAVHGERLGSDSEARAARLRELGATESDLPALLAYTDSPYAAAARRAVTDGTDESAAIELPLPDEPHVEVWREYAHAAESEGALPVLARALVQLRFPVAQGVSQTEAYRAATRRGENPPPAFRMPPGLDPGESGCEIEDPEGIQVLIHESPAGAVPVIVARARADFITLVRALSARNEPEPVPDSMGALFVAGYNNWDRVRRYRETWARSGSPGGDWSEEFKRLIPRKELYQDRFILVSTGPYSGVAPGLLGLGSEEWSELSARIRIEHEATHHFTRRVFGTMRTNLFDELLADAMGLVFATGRFRSSWLLHFLGLEAYPEYRAGGRLENYLGEIGPTGDAARVLRALVYDAIGTLGRLRALEEPDTAARARILSVLCRFDLVELGVPGAASVIEEALAAG